MAVTDDITERKTAGTDESALLAGLRANEEWAYEELVHVFGGRLLAVARRILRDEEGARDVVQSAYLSAFQSIGRFEGGCQLATWLHRIVVNAALMKLRSRRRRPEESIEPLLPAFLADGHHSTQFREGELQPDVLLEQQTTRAIVRACIDELPERYRTVLILRDIEDVPGTEAARLLGTTPNAVKIRLHRARQALTTLVRARLAPGSQTRHLAATRGIQRP